MLNHKILVLLLYWDRPEMVRNALESLKEANSDNWELAFLDDSSNYPGTCVGEQIFGHRWFKMKRYNSLMTHQEKTESGGMVGRLMNEAIRNSESDLAIILCDDDAVHPDYFIHLDKWFYNNPDEYACHSHVHEFNPIFENYRKVDNPVSKLNHIGRINPWAQVDASQVAWRTSLNKERGIWFEEGRTKCLDAKFYRSMFNAIGEIPFSGFIGQYKGFHASQLVHHDVDDLWTGKNIDTKAGLAMTEVEALHPIINRYIQQGDPQEALRICNKAIELYPADTRLYLLLRDASELLLRDASEFKAKMV